MSPRPLYEGSDHNLTSNRTVGNPHPQYMRKKEDFVDLYATFHSATLWGARPDTGANMTAELQAAFDNAPLGSTIYVRPGTYVVSPGSLALSRNVNLWAYGAVLDIGTTAIAAGQAVLTIGNTKSSGGSDKVRKQSYRGLWVKRSPAGTLSADATGIGIKYLSLYECHIEDMIATSFAKGHLCTGSYNVTDGESGLAYCNFFNLHAFDCRYGYRLEPGDATAGPPAKSGWCNGNRFFGGRIANGFTDILAVGDGASVNAALYIQWQMAGGSPEAHECNDNHFYGVNFENLWARKIFNESRYNTFFGCRYETARAGAPFANRGVYWGSVPNNTDIEFKDTTGLGGGSLGAIMHGYDLINNIISLPAGSQNYVEDQQYHTHGDLARHVIRGSGSTPPMQISNDSGGTQPGYALLASNRADLRLVLKESPDASAYVAGIVGYTGGSGGTERNWLGLRNASPYWWAVQKGFRVNVSGDADGDFVVQGDTVADLIHVDASTDFVGINTATPGDRLDVVGTTRVRATAGDAFMVADASNNEKFWVDTDTLVCMVTGNLDFVVDGGLADLRGDATVSGILSSGARTLGRVGVADANHNVGVNDEIIAYTSISAARTVNLQAAATAGAGRIIRVKDESGSCSVVNTITIDGSGAETIDGAATLVLAAARASATIYCDGAAWHILGRYL